MKLPIALIIIGLVLIGGSWYVLQPKQEEPAGLAGTAEVPEGATVVTLTEDGFVPSELTISKGTTVAFVSETGKLFWPASNLHPSHTIYPEFDPLLPVKPDAAWSFTFENAGEWKYHDHLAPYYTGVITVTE